MGVSDFWDSFFGGSAEDAPAASEGSFEPTSEEPGRGEEGTGQRRYLTIGVDWGTSTTKVVMRDPYGPGSPAYLVNFGSFGADASPYLLPSALSVDESGFVRLGRGQEGISIPEMKVHLLRNPTESLPVAFDAQPRELAALYIAGVLRYARQWLMENYGDRYRPYQIVWGFNLGIPAASHDNEGVRALYARLARVGWGLSEQESSRVRDARAAYRALAQGDFETRIHEDLVHVIPEIAAQVTGYAQSSLRRPGLHVLVDVGASTLDLGGFMLTEQEGEDRFSILQAGVYTLGAFQLERDRLPDLKALGRDVLDSGRYERWADEMARRCENPMRKVPSSIQEYFPADVRADIREADVKHFDTAFEEDCYTTIRALIADLRRDRAPKGKRWREGLPIFLAGGGKGVAVYREALEAVDHWRENYLTAAPFDIRDLPSLEDLIAADLDPGQEHRFSVAYGLSYPGDDIGEIKPPHEIPDLDLDSDTQSLDATDYRDTKAWT